jgi:phosphate transport system substrate-binding protein
VIQTKGAIGYVEYAYALENKMASVKMINKDGKAVAPNAAAFQAAAANADWAHSDNYYVVLTNQPGAESWPIAGATFILMYKQPQDPASSAEALKFFDWAYTKGDRAAEELDYVPLPDAVTAQIEKTWGEIKGPDGKPVYMAAK